MNFFFSIPGLWIKLTVLKRSDEMCARIVHNFEVKVFGVYLLDTMLYIPDIVLADVAARRLTDSVLRNRRG